MHTIRKVGLITALHTLQTTEFVLDGLIRTRPYLPAAAFSLLSGFIIGFLLTHS